jgi:hypothetical protein
MASHDWFEGVSTVVGVLFFVGSAACVWALAVNVASLGDEETDLSRESTILSGSNAGALQSTRWFGIVLFAVLAIVLAAAGWFLAGDAVRRATARVRSR